MKQMVKNVAAICALTVLTVAACQSTVSDPTPVKEPQKLDCDLIFPMPTVNV
jgi:hypothetical protein